jgi:glutamate 5-kinase
MSTVTPPVPFTPEDDVAAAWPFKIPPRRIVIKLGSNILTTKGRTLDVERIRIVAEQVSALRAAGMQVAIVSSGAVAAGMGARGETKRPTELARLQALAAIGQCRLMTAWNDAFLQHGTSAAQVLVTRNDLDDRQRYLNAQQTMEALLDMGAVPVINENDTVLTEELTFGDNDMLSAVLTAVLAAELLVVMTDIEGLFTAPPKENPDAQLIPVVRVITPEVERLAGGIGSTLGRGGMQTKVSAARHATSFGIPTVIADGRRNTMLTDVLSGRFRGTLFLPRPGSRLRGKSRTHWIAMRRPKGTVVIDDGARTALVEKNRSLLPVGVVGVEGSFVRGDIIAIRTSTGEEVGRGLSNFTSQELGAMRGKKGEELAEVLGPRAANHEVIHRNNLHLR